MSTYTNLICEICHKTFNRNSRDMASYKNKNLNHIYCSRHCKGIANSKKIEITCVNCFKSIWRTPSHMNKNKNSFCSLSCAASYNNRHKTYGCNRSKLEIYLEQQIHLMYPTLELICNDRQLLNGIELDFYFPSISLAIELNGIFHYEPIFGESQLAKIQNKDQQKIYLCNQKQINLAVIDASQHKNLTSKVKDKFLKIFKQIIDSAIH